MTLAEWVQLTLKTSIAVLVFTVGLGTRPGELTDLLRHPRQLVRSLFAMNVVMLIIAVVIVKLAPLHNAVKITLVAMALSPLPPMLPRRLLKAGGSHAYVMALLFSASLFAIVWIPLATWIIDKIFPPNLATPPGPVAQLVVMTLIAPLLAGVAVGRLAPKLAERLTSPLSVGATVLLFAAAILMLVKAGPAILAQIGDGTVIAIAAFVILGLAVGHLLGGPTPGDRSVLALASASRHPAIAMAIARLNLPNEKAVPAAVLLYLLIAALLTLPYVMWRKKAIDAEPAPAPERPPGV